MQAERFVGFYLLHSAFERKCAMRTRHIRASEFFVNYDKTSAWQLRGYTALTYRELC